MMQRRTLAPRVCGGLFIHGLILGLGGLPSAQAQGSVSCSALTEFRQFSPSWTQTGPVDNTAQGCDSQLNVPGFGAAVATGDVAPGVLRLDVSANTLGQSQPQTTRVSAAAQVSFEEGVRINVPGAPNFAMGTITVAIQYNGFFQLGGPGFATGGARVQACFGIFGFVNAGGFQCSAGGNLLQPMNLTSWNQSPFPQGVGEPGFAINAAHTLTFPVRLNREVEFAFWLNAHVNVQGVDQSIIGAFGNSAYWGGIVEVRDNNGNLLSLDPNGGPGTYNLVNSSGFNWHASTVPIPEPGTWALLALGLAGIGWRARQQRATGQPPCFTWTAV
jgi:hypothetical protein